MDHSRVPDLYVVGLGYGPFRPVGFYRRQSVVGEYLRVNGTAKGIPHIFKSSRTNLHVVIAEGSGAPGFELPGVVEGERTTVDLADYIGEQVVVLAFYPGDFNVVGTGEHAGLETLDIFTMQKDVTVLGISGDSISSHRAFAEAQDLRIPLLADVEGEVARDYGVYEPDAGHQNRRAVIVVDLDGEVAYAWSASDTDEAPDIRAVREAFDAIGSNPLAAAQYQEGYERYTEARTALADGIAAYEDNQWMDAISNFDTAYEGFSNARNAFDSASRFSEDREFHTECERADTVTEELVRVAEWFAGAAQALVLGKTMEGERLETDAEDALERADDIGEPAEPGAAIPGESGVSDGESVVIDDTEQGMDTGAKQGDDSGVSETDGSNNESSLTRRAQEGRGDKSTPSAVDRSAASSTSMETDSPTEQSTGNRPTVQTRTGGRSSEPGRSDEYKSGYLPDWDEVGDEIDVDGETLDLTDPTENEEGTDSGDTDETSRTPGESDAADDDTVESAGTAPHTEEVEGNENGTETEPDRGRTETEPDEG